MDNRSPWEHPKEESHGEEIKRARGHEIKEGRKGGRERERDREHQQARRKRDQEHQRRKGSGNEKCGTHIPQLHHSSHFLALGLAGDAQHGHLFDVLVLQQDTLNVQGRDLRSKHARTKLA